MKPESRVRLSAAGLAANPELRDKTGFVVERGEAVEIRWDGAELSCWLKPEFVEDATPAPLPR